MKKIETTTAPQAIGPYSQAILHANFLFVSGQLGIKPESGKIEDQTLEGQTRQALTNIKHILEAGNTSLASVVRTEIYLIDLVHFSVVNQIYAEFFTHPIQPARQTVQVSRLPLDALIEISCIAHVS